MSRLAFANRQVAPFPLSRDKACGLQLGSSTTGSDRVDVSVVVVAVYIDIL